MLELVFTTVLVIGFNVNKLEFYFFQHLTNRKVGQRKTVQSNIITQTCLGFEIICFISKPGSSKSYLSITKTQHVLWLDVLVWDVKNIGAQNIMKHLIILI
jgi:hypothetical protein